MKNQMRFCLLLTLPLLLPKTIKSAEVNHDGSFSHRIEIKIPPGTHDMAPKLSLVYNSNASNGILGKGWLLTGLPVISRDTSYPLAFDGNDEYIGSGGRLVLIANATYHHERENMSRVVAHGNDNMPLNNSNKCGDGPCFWVETLKNGTQLTYGQTSDSTIEIESQNDSRLMWALNKVTDLKGNSYEIEYITETAPYQNQLYPKRIVYTTGNGLSTFRTINFEYIDRPDISVSYRTGTPILTSKILEKISIKIGEKCMLGICMLGSLVREYRFSYGLSHSKDSLLLSLQEFGSDSSTFLPKKTFKYDTTSSFEPAQTFLDSSRDIDPADPTYWVDFNGDGRIDFCRIELTGRDHMECIISGPNGFTFNYESPELTSPIGNVLWGDIDGNGKADFCRVAQGQLRCFRSNGLDFRAEIVKEIPKSDANEASVASLEGMALVDFNGDGRSDFCWRSEGIVDPNDTFLTKFSTLSCWLSTGADFTTVVESDEVQWGQQGYGSWVDFNGDGLTDYCSVNSLDRLYCILSDKTVFGEIIEGPDQITTGSTDYAIWLDYNGDGKTDYCQDRIQGKLGCFLSNGFTFVAGAISGIPSVGGETSTWADFNGDRRTDLCILSENGSTVSPACQISQSAGWRASDFVQTTHVLNEASDKLRRWVDINNDGKTDFCSMTNDGSGNAISCMIATTNPTEKLIEIDNGITGKFHIEYKNPVEFQEAIASLPVESYPLRPNTSKRKLVSRLSRSDGRGGLYSTSYDYKGGALVAGPNKDDKRLLGFQEFIQTNEQTQQSSQTILETSHTLNRYRNGMVIRKNMFTGSPNPGVLVSSEEFFHEDISLYSGQTTLIRGRSHTSGVAKKTSFYNAGTKISEKSQRLIFDDSEDYKSDDAIEIHDIATGTTTIVTRFAYFYDEVRWVIGRITQRRELANNQVLRLKNLVFTNDNLVESSEWLNDGSFANKVYDYDSFGNIISSTDPIGTTTYNTYDSTYHTFTIKSSNTLGFEINRIFDAGIGKITEEIDFNGNETTYEYDALGRLVEVKEPGDPFTKRIIYNQNTNQNPNENYTETRTKDDSADGYVWHRKYFDGLERTYREESEGFADQSGNAYTIRIDTEFDNAGRIGRKSNAYPSPGGSPEFTQYRYDSMSRESEIEHPESSPASPVISKISYGPMKQIETDAEGSSKTTTFDARGRVLTIEEPGNVTISFEYDALGRTIKKTDADGFIAEYTYDSLNRKTSMIEPNTGLWAYTYDKAGNLTQTTDPKGQTIINEYDTLGRLKKTTYPAPELPVEYIYDEAQANNGLGRLTSINDATGKTELSYDEKGNKSTWIRETNGVRFSFQAQYDAQSRLQELTYPDGERVIRYYADSGYLRQVRILGPNQAFGVPVVTYKGPEQGINNQLQRVTGNTVTSTITYDPKTLKPTRLETVLSDNTTKVQDLGYVYNKVGNITAIVDHQGGAKSQSFTYDSLHRLSSASSPLYGSINYEHTKGGNLIRKGSRQLKFGADCSLPGPVHAPCEDNEGNAFTYDNNGNMVTRYGRDLAYDSRNRLKSVSEGGITKVSYGYDFQGNRTVKEDLTNNSKTYSLYGLYEVTTGSTETHTKYIYGIDRDRVMQITRDSSSITLAMVDQQVPRAYASFFSTSFQNGAIFSKIYYSIIANRESVFIAPVLLIFVLGFVLFLHVIVRNWGLYSSQQKIFSPTSSILILMLSFLLYSNCSGSGPVTIEAPPYGDVLGNPVPGGVKDVGDTPNVYNDNYNSGKPVIGAYYFHPDHLGSVALITDNSGNKVITELNHKPYGEIIRNKSSGPDIFRFKYNGKESDAETSLMYYGARYYDASLGTFITSDNLIGNNEDSQSQNRYMYVRGNPVEFNDPSGNLPIIGVLVVFVAAIVSNPILVLGVGIVGGLLQAGLTDFTADNFFNGFFAATGVLLGIATGTAVVTALTPGFGVFTGLVIGGATGGFVASASAAAIQGSDFGTTLLAGFAGAFTGAVSGGFATAMGFHAAGHFLAATFIGATHGQILSDPIGTLQKIAKGDFEFSEKGLFFGALMGLLGSYALTRGRFTSFELTDASTWQNAIVAAELNFAKAIGNGETGAGLLAFAAIGASMAYLSHAINEALLNSYMNENNNQLPGYHDKVALKTTTTIASGTAKKNLNALFAKRREDKKYFYGFKSLFHSINIVPDGSKNESNSVSFDPMDIFLFAP